MTRNRVVQPILGLVASSAPKPLTASQRELVRRAGTYLSVSQRMAARRRAQTAQATAQNDDAPPPRNVAALMPSLRFGRKMPHDTGP